MAGDTVVVIDAGTSALRSVAVRFDGSVHVLADEPWPMFTPDDAAPFGREFRLPELRGALQRVIDAAAPVRERVAALAFTGQREGVAFVDDRGDAVFASPNVDARASAQGMTIDAAHGDDVYATTGHLPSLMQVPAKLEWLRENRPEVASRIRSALPLADWLAAAFGGESVMSRSLAAENGLLDVRTSELATQLLRELGMVGCDVLPVAADGSAIGAVSVGVLMGVPIVLAGADTQCALLGMGVTHPGQAGVPAGWSAPVQLVTDRPTFDCEQRTWTGLHVVPERWILESNAGETGRAWEWMLSLMSLTSAEADALAAASPVGARDVMSVLGPRVMHAAEMNAGVGAITMPLPIVMSIPDRGDVLRSVLESIAFAVRSNLEQLEYISGIRVASLGLGGGMSQSCLFVQMVADVLDRPVEVARSAHTTAVGAAVLAFESAKTHPSLDAAQRAMAEPRTVIAPDASASAAYDDYYGRWCALADATSRLGEIG